MSKNCEFKPGFVEKMANNYNEAMSGNSEAARMYKLYTEVADEAIKDNPSCLGTIFKGSKGQFNEDMLKGKVLEIPRLNY